MKLSVFVAVCVIGLSSSTVSAQSAGELVSAEPVVDTPSGTQAWKIAYWTTDG